MNRPVDIRTRAADALPITAEPQRLVRTMTIDPYLEPDLYEPRPPERSVGEECAVMGRELSCGAFSRLGAWLRGRLRG